MSSQNAESLGRLRCLAGAMLIIGCMALLLSSPRLSGDETTWEQLLVPYSEGQAFPGGFRIADMRRGTENDVVLSIERPDGKLAVEVHVLQRHRWTTVHETRSFGIVYELPKSPAAEREEITAIVAQTIRSRDHGLPPPDAIPLRTATDPTALPWWLELLRGWRGALLGLNLALAGLIGAVRGRAFSLLGVALGGVDFVTFGINLPSDGPDLGSWCLPVAAVLLFLALRGRLHVPRKDLFVALGVTGFALCLRLVLGPWGPLHVNGYGPRFIAGAAQDPESIAPYGPGYGEFFSPIAALAPSNPDWAIFAFNAFLCALVPVAALALGRMVGLTRRAAVLAALLLAIDPVAIRMGATESYFPAIISLSTWAAVLLVVAVAWEGSMEAWRIGGCLIAAALLMVQAARIHPSAWLPLATVPYVVLAVPSLKPSRRLASLAACIAVVAGVMLTTSGGALLDTLARVRIGAVTQLPPPPPVRPLLAVGAAIVMYMVFVPRPWLAIAAAIPLAALALTQHAYWQSAIWQQSFSRLYLTVPLLALVAALPAALLSRRWLLAGLGISVTCGWLWFGLPIVRNRTTDHLEYRWLRDQLRKLPAECRVIHLEGVANRGVEIPTYVRGRSAPAVALNLDRPHTIAAGLAPASCIYYVRTSLCSSADTRPACEAIESRLDLRPIARATFPARPSSWLIPYDADSVETVIARVEHIDDVRSEADTKPSPTASQPVAARP